MKEKLYTQEQMDEAFSELDQQERWDRFAAAALAGLAGWAGTSSKETARLAAEYADAMLAESNKNKPK